MQSRWVTAPGCSSLPSWSKMRATRHHRDAGMGDPREIQELFDLNLLHSFTSVNTPWQDYTSWVSHLASCSHHLLKLLPRYWTKINLCDLITQCQTWDRQNRWRRLVLFLWQTSYQRLTTLKRLITWWFLPPLIFSVTQGHATGVSGCTVSACNNLSLHKGLWCH